MPSLVPLVILLCASFVVSARKLTTEENERNAQKCGVHFLGNDNESKSTLSKKSYGGRKIRQNEYPWTLILTLKDPLHKEEQGLCSGVQISPRHILTAAHCVLAFDEDYNKVQCSLNRSYSAVSVMRSPKDVAVYIGGDKTDCNDPLICPSYKAKYTTAKITVQNYDICNFEKDLALIELSHNISEAHSTPICMPTENLPLDNILYASGSGMDYGTPKTLNDPNRHSRGQQVVAQRLYGVDENTNQIITLTFAKIPLPGDSGGPLFQSNESDTHTLVGIASFISGSSNLRPEIVENLMGVYTDVRANLDWICKYSGVCPLEEPPSNEVAKH